MSVGPFGKTRREPPRTRAGACKPALSEKRWLNDAAYRREWINAQDAWTRNVLNMIAADLAQPVWRWYVEVLDASQQDVRTVKAAMFVGWHSQLGGSDSQRVTLGRDVGTIANRLMGGANLIRSDHFRVGTIATAHALRALSSACDSGMFGAPIVESLQAMTEAGVANDDPEQVLRDIPIYYKWMLKFCELGPNAIDLLMTAHMQYPDAGPMTTLSHASITAHYQQERMFQPEDPPTPGRLPNAAAAIRRCAGDPSRGGGACDARERGFCQAAACRLENASPTRAENAPLCHMGALTAARIPSLDDLQRWTATLPAWARRYVTALAIDLTVAQAGDLITHYQLEPRAELRWLPRKVAQALTTLALFDDPAPLQELREDPVLRAFINFESSPARSTQAWFIAELLRSAFHLSQASQGPRGFWVAEALQYAWHLFPMGVWGDAWGNLYDELSVFCSFPEGSRTRLALTSIRTGSLGAVWLIHTISPYAWEGVPDSLAIAEDMVAERGLSVDQLRGDERITRIFSRQHNPIPQFGAYMEGSADCPPPTSDCLDPMLIHADPARFQFKAAATGAGGTSDILRDVQIWDPLKAGRILVWQDPDWRPLPDPKHVEPRYYVVDGHHRLELAQRLQRTTGSPKLIEVDLLPRGTSATRARTLGAIRNLAAGRGTAIDAANVMREIGGGPAALQAEGLSLREGIVAQGQALSQLTPAVFGMVESGQLTTEQGSVIGKALPADADPPRSLQRQRAAVRMVLDKGLKGAQLREAVDLIAATPATKEKGLFGDEDKLLIVERAAILSAARRELSRDVRIFRAIAREADRIEKAGAGAIDRPVARRAGEEADVALDALTRLAWARGSAIAELLNEGSEAVHKSRGRKTLEKWVGRVVAAARELPMPESRAANATCVVGGDAIERCTGDPDRIAKARSEIDAILARD